MKNFLIKNNKGRRVISSSKGFTLVETLVSLAIFSVAILALLVVLTQNLSDTNNSKRKIIASYLAEEGIEYMRNMRDTHTLYTVPALTGWNNFYTKVVGAGNQICAQAQSRGCYFADLSAGDYANNVQPMASLVIVACGQSCPALLYDGTQGKYNYNTGTASGFIRKITVIPISANEMKVVSTVYWDQGPNTYSVVFSDSLFNWVE